MRNSLAVSLVRQVLAQVLLQLQGQELVVQELEY